MAKKLGLHQRVWLKLDSEETPMHGIILAKFSKVEIDSALKLYKHFIAYGTIESPWNSVIDDDGQIQIPGGNSSAGGFSIRDHVFYTNLKAPGGEKELGEVVSRLHSTHLNIDKPRWEVHIIDDLLQHQFALIIKVHRCLMDHSNGLELFFSMMSEEQGVTKAKPFWSVAETKECDGKTPDDGNFSGSKTSKLSSIKQLLKGLVLSVRDSAGVRKRFSLTKAPKSALNLPIDSSRRVSTTALSLERLKDVAKKTDSQLNEILTYLCGSALRRFFKEYNALPKSPFIALVPVSLDNKTRHGESATTAIRLSLATHIGDKEYRLEAVKKSVEHVNLEIAHVPEEVLPSFSIMRVTPFLISQIRGVGRLLPRVYNLVVSHSKGQGSEGEDKQRYLQGNKLREVYPIHPLLQNAGLSINSVTYNNKLLIGVVGAERNLPHVQRLSVYIDAALDELCEAIEERELRHGTIQ